MTQAHRHQRDSDPAVHGAMRDTLSFPTHSSRGQSSSRSRTEPAQSIEVKPLSLEALCIKRRYVQGSGGGWGRVGGWGVGGGGLSPRTRNISFGSIDPWIYYFPVFYLLLPASARSYLSSLRAIGRIASLLSAQSLLSPTDLEVKMVAADIRSSEFSSHRYRFREQLRFHYLGAVRSMSTVCRSVFISGS